MMSKPPYKNTPGASSDLPLRLSKLMGERGLCSRREADALISRGLVYVNGEKVTELGVKVTPDVRITLDPRALQEQKTLATIILNKPVGYVSAQPEKGYEPAIVLIKNQNQEAKDNRELEEGHFENLAVVGRLDIDSHGLLLFTQDGRLAKKIIGEQTSVEKEYLVRIQGLDQISKLEMKKKLELLRYGLSLDGEKLKPARVEQMNDNQLQFVLTEGKKRQLRRMCELVEMKVIGLKRVRIGNIMLGHLPLGNWRFLSPEEIKGFSGTVNK